MKLRKKFNAWWVAERVGRVEEGTSQDMCPTNGDAVTMTLIFSAPWCLLLIVIFTQGIIGVK